MGDLRAPQAFADLLLPTANFFPKQSLSFGVLKVVLRAPAGWATAHNFLILFVNLVVFTKNCRQVTANSFLIFNDFNSIRLYLLLIGAVVMTF